MRRVVLGLKEYKDGGLTDALFDLWAEEKEKRRPSGFLPLLALLIVSVALSFFSFLFYKEESTGTLALAKEALSELLEENEAISVFLGLLDEGEER